MILFHTIGLQLKKFDFFSQKSVFWVDCSMTSHVRPNEIYEIHFQLFATGGQSFEKKTKIFSTIYKCRSPCVSFHDWTGNFTYFWLDFWLNFLFEQRAKLVLISSPVRVHSPIKYANTKKQYNSGKVQPVRKLTLFKLNAVLYEYTQYLWVISSIPLAYISSICVGQYAVSLSHTVESRI